MGWRSIRSPLFFALLWVSVFVMLIGPALPPADRAVHAATPYEEIIERATGKGLDASAFFRHLERKGLAHKPQEAALSGA